MKRISETKYISLKINTKANCNRNRNRNLNYHSNNNPNPNNISQVQLELPYLSDMETAYQFLQKRELWIRKNLRQNVIDPKNKKEESDATQNKLLIFGKSYNLVYEKGKSNFVELTDKEIIVKSSDRKHKKILVTYLEKNLMEEIIRIMSDFNEGTKNLSYQKVRINRAKTKWSNCSSQKNAAFNFVLVFAPKEIIEYVVMHEMCHLEEMKHNEKFWSLVKQYYPNYKEARLWLNQKGHTLYKSADSIGV